MANENVWPEFFVVIFIHSTISPHGVECYSVQLWQFFSSASLLLSGLHLAPRYVKVLCLCKTSFIYSFKVCWRRLNWLNKFQSNFLCWQVGKIVIGGLLALVFVAVSAPGEICEIICKRLFAQQSKVHVFLKIWKICLA